LLEKGILYPESGLEGHHHYWVAKGLGFCFPREKFDRDVAARALVDLDNELSRSACRTVLLSSEHFDFNVPEGAGPALAEYFDGWQVSIIGFLRNQIDYAQSLYIEHLKWGGALTFREFLDNTQRKFDFFEKFSCWQNLQFDTRMLDYDACKGDLLRHFLDATELRVDGLDFTPPDGAKNVSPSIDFMELVRQLNVGSSPEVGRRRYLDMAAGLEALFPDASPFPLREWRFPVGTHQTVREWQQSNRRLAELLGEDFEQFLGGPLLPRFVAMRDYLPPNLSECLQSNIEVIRDLIAYEPPEEGE
jgi:hypothetical protein